MLAVIAFHAAPALAPGGFAGVDVFFVISGFLITRIITEEIDGGDFSFARFYARRARRIFPALIVVLLATLALGWAMLLPDEFAQLGLHVVGGSLFSSNLLLWREAGYFDVAAAQKPLLHLWSLGIEEQFYLVWPVTLIATRRLRDHRALVIGTIAVASFALSIVGMKSDLSGTFYSPVTRAWELMIGAFLAVTLTAGASSPSPGASATAPWYTRRDAREIASIIGVVLLVVSCMRLNSQIRFPGWYALLPTGGAALLIAAGQDAWLNRRLLGNPVAVFVGLISYPLYLWHWPLLVFARLGIETLGLTIEQEHVVIAKTVGVSFLAAALTYYLVERPVRRSTRLGPVSVRLSLGLALATMLAAVVWQWPTPRIGDDPDVARAVAARSDFRVGDGLHFTSDTHRDPDVVFIGDSHAERYFPAAQHAADAMRPSPVVLFATKGGCAFLPALLGEPCRASYRSWLALASGASVRRVVIVSDWAGYVDARFGRLPNGSTYLKGEDGRMATPTQVDSVFRLLAADIAGLRALGKDVVLVLSHPGSPLADPTLLAGLSRLPFHRVSRPGLSFATTFPLAEFQKRSAWIDGKVAMVARLAGAGLIDPASHLCTNGACITQDERGTPIRSDGGHLRPFAAIRYLPYVAALVSVGTVH